MSQQVPPPLTPYGPSISLHDVRRVVDAAEGEAKSNHCAVAVVIVDSGGHMVMAHRLDNAQLASMRIAEAKARTAVEFRRPTRVFEDAIAGGGIGLRVLTFGVSAAEGGEPIVSGGRIIGAIGVSGGISGTGRTGREGRRSRHQVTRGPVRVEKRFSGCFATDSPP
jgi:glc operon protein GlcG